MVRSKKAKPGLPEIKRAEEFENALLDLARVTRVTKGGKRMSFRACVALGNRAGQIGVGVAKGADVSGAIEKAVRVANKNLITVPIINETIPHWIKKKYCASLILLRPAPPGWGIVAGGATRVILALAGVKNVTAKMLGSRNKMNNARATIEALRALKT